jgi:hypothetical protein
VEELWREKSNSRRAKELQLYVMGYKSHWSRIWTAGRMEALGVCLIVSPLIVPWLDEGRFRLPSGGEWIGFLIFMGIGAFMLYLRRNPRAEVVDADLHTHRPWIDRVETTDGEFFQGMCDCDWRGAMARKERRAELEAHRHVARRHWPQWMGRFAGDG